MALENTRVIFKKRPEQSATPDCFDVVKEPLAPLGPDQVRVEVEYVSVDAGVRTMLRGEGFHRQVPLGGTIHAGGIGRVIESTADGWEQGQAVRGGLGAQTIATVPTSQLEKVDDLPGLSLSAHLGVLGGSTGVTAWIGMRHVACPKPGDTFVVSAAAGAVGSIAGQIAKKEGARVIGIAGGDRKTAYLVDQLGFDAAIDYKNEDVAARIAELAPKGIDIYFDNVGGNILEIALAAIAQNARIVMCGGISSGYTMESLPPGPSTLTNLIIQRGRMEGFIVLDFADRFLEAIIALGTWVSEGKIVYQEDIAEGLENCPETLARLFEGKNLGKQLLKIADVV